MAKCIKCGKSEPAMHCICGECAKTEAETEQQKEILRNHVLLLEKEVARVTAERNAAVKDMTALAYTIRQRSENDTECCGLCKFDGEAWQECPGFETDECFEWRGLQEVDADVR